MHKILVIYNCLQDLMQNRSSLRDVSKVIGNLNIGQRKTVDEIRFGITTSPKVLRY